MVNFQVEDNPIGQSNIQEIGSNSDESSPEVVVTKGGVVVDMLSGSEAEGSTTEDSSEESGDDDKSGETGSEINVNISCRLWKSLVGTRDSNIT